MTRGAIFSLELILRINLAPEGPVPDLHRMGEVGNRDRLSREGAGGACQEAGRGARVEEW